MVLDDVIAGISRRAALGSAIGAGLGLAAMPGLTHARAAGRILRPLDVLDPRENLHAFARMWGTLGPRAVLSGYQGVQYAVIGKQRARALFGYCGFGNIRNVLQPDGSVQVMGKECAYFTDLATGQVMDHWDNPWTGERVEVYNFFNDKFRGHLGLTRKVFKVGDGETVNNDHTSGAKPAAAEPFLLPWQKIGDQYLLSWDYAHEYTNPVTPEGWPRASSGRRINPSEHFTLYTPAAEIEDRDRPSARYMGGFTRQAPWWPWMKMGPGAPNGPIDGVLIGRMHSYKITGGVDDVPRAVLDRVVKDRPDLLEEPTPGPDEGVVDTFGRYAGDVPPEVAGYQRP